MGKTLQSFKQTSEKNSQRLLCNVKGSNKPLQKHEKDDVKEDKIGMSDLMFKEKSCEKM